MTLPIKVEPVLHLGVGCVTGTDPELFIVNSRGTVVRAKKYVEMCKVHSKKKTPPNNNNIIWDNVAVELQPSAGTCAQHVIDRLGLLIRSMFGTLLDSSARKGYDLCTTPALPVTRSNRKAEVLEFGCSPAMLVMNQETVEVRPLIDPRECEFRSIGGHLHMSSGKPYTTLDYNTPVGADGRRVQHFTVLNNMRNGEPFSALEILKSEDERVKLTQMYDILLGTVGCLFEYRMGNQEAALIRRMMIGYGRAGEFRVNKRSYEYRTLSPWWLEHPLLAHLVLNLSRDIYRLWECDGCADKFLADFNDRAMIEEAINECNPVECEKILVRGIKAFTNVRKQYGVVCEYDTILGYKARPTQMIKVLAHKPADWFKFLATQERGTYAKNPDVEYNQGSNRRAPVRAAYFSLLRRWNFSTHYWGWKDFASRNTTPGANEGVRAKPLGGTYITDHWAAEAATAKSEEKVA